MLPQKQVEYLYEELGARIKKYRLAKGFKQTQFANLIKISRPSLVNIEKGRQHPPLHNLYEIARMLDVKLVDLLPDLTDTTLTNVDVMFEEKIKLESAGNPETENKLREFVRSQQSSRKK
jgi:transcriptional regulator with XRE-family HTH domain